MLSNSNARDPLHRILLAYNRIRRHQASSGSGPGSTRIILAYSAAYRDPRESTMHKYLIVLIWIPVHRALCGSRPRQETFSANYFFHFRDQTNFFSSWIRTRYFPPAGMKHPIGFLNFFFSMCGENKLFFTLSAKQTFFFFFKQKKQPPPPW